jgi:hypothetical protein
MSHRTNRRRFLGQSAAIATGFWLGASSTSRAGRSANGQNKVNKGVRNLLHCKI